MAFKSKTPLKLSTDSPESLFADIKSKKIPGLLTQQGDLLREYVASFVDSSDLSAQLPTGSGKTLVALLIAEWRRITRQERVVYLCPTKQLVHQVAQQAREKYGINVEAFTGSRRDYDATQKLRYNSSQAIAVTTYSSLFNSNPFFEDPNLIIFDDAHAAEQYVSSNWTFDIRKINEDDQVLFDAICATLKPHIREVDYDRLTSEAQSSWDLSWVEKLPYEKALGVFPDLESVIESNVGKSEARHAWKALKGKLEACNIFLGSRRITIRPYLAPTFSHAPFQNATQRIYLSATPGEGGELERVFCRKQIERLTPPAHSDRHAVGRRFFIFPELSLDEKDQIALLTEVAKARRMLCLVGDNATSETYKEFFNDQTPTTVFSAKDIETSKLNFVQTTPAVAVLANRYDGIDFPEDECRLTMLVDIPTAANPQENFFINRLAASRVYDARILTRIIQAFGRCTRGATDYGVVLIFGDRITSFLSKKDRQSYFHPELQGELLFGFEESTDTTLTDTLQNIDHFLSQDDDWKEAEAQIYQIRDVSEQADLEGSSNLAEAVRHEVEFMNSLWNANYLNALEACRSVLAQLNDPSLRGVRALWNYFAGSMATRLSKSSTDQYKSQSKEYYRTASKAAPSLSWLNDLVSSLDSFPHDDDITKAESEQLDRIEAHLSDHGMSHNRNFDTFENKIREALLKAKTFEKGHELLGNHLGFSAGKIESPGSPDPWWQYAEHSIIVFEDHAGAEENSSLSITKARQTTTHENWVRENLIKKGDLNVTIVLISPVTNVDKGAMCHLDKVLLWNLQDFRNWAESCFEVIRQLRKEFREPGDLEWRQDALGVLRDHNLTADKIIAQLPAAKTVLQEPA